MLTVILTRNEWHLDQGLIGYKRILENAGETILTTDEGIIFEEQHLEKLPEAYFNYFLDKYSVSKREENYLRTLWGLQSKIILVRTLEKWERLASD